MTEPREKSPRQLYEETKEKITKYEADVESAKSESAKDKKRASLNSAKQLLKEIESELNKPYLSKGVRTHLVDKYVSHKYGRETEISSKYIDKGNKVEEDSLTLYSEYKNVLYFKNEQFYSNEFICGTPDIVKGDIVIDIKSSWDIFSFFRSKHGDKNDLYYWQLQSYMALTGAKSAKLVYCLVDTPDSLIEQEKRNLFYKMGSPSQFDELYSEACEKIERLGKYKDIPIAERINEITIERNDADIERLYARIKECRQWMELNLITPAL